MNPPATPASTPASRRAPATGAWRGRALLVIAALHVAFTIVVGSTAHHDPKLHPFVGTASPWTALHPGFGADFPPKLWLLSLVWSLFFGGAIALLGVLVHTVERSGAPVARPFSIGLLVFALLGAVLMPASGFWFVAFVALSMVRRPGATGGSRDA